LIAQRRAEQISVSQFYNYSKSKILLIH